MFMIVFSVLITLGWFCIGLAVLSQPVISHISYACAWSIVLVYDSMFVIAYISDYLRNRKSSRQ